MRLGQNYFVTCSTCGGLGHSASHCAARNYYHHQAIRAVLSGKADVETIREAIRTASPPAGVIIKRIVLTAVLLFLACNAFAQGGGFQTVAQVQAQGNLVQVVPFAPVVVCGYPATGPTPCTNLAATFDTPTLTNPCSPTAQIVIPTTNSCVSLSDAAGNFSFNSSSGNYSYFYKALGTWHGPYNVTFSSGGTTPFALVTNPASSTTNTVVPPNPTTIPIISQCPLGAAASLNCLQVNNLSGTTIFTVAQNGNVQVGTGAPGTVAGAQFLSSATTGTPPFTVASTTNVPNLNASSLSGNTFPAPGPIGGGTPSTSAFTSGSYTGQVTSTLATGTSPFAISSKTATANLNVESVAGFIGPVIGTVAPTCVVDGVIHATIATCSTALGTLGFSTSGTILSQIPEEFTADPFINFHGTIILGHQTGTGNTCRTTAPFNCYTTEVPLTLPTHLRVTGQGAASRTQGPYNSSSVINPGTSYPTKLGIPANATNWTGTGNHIPNFNCAATGGHLSDGTYPVVVWEELDRTGGTGGSNTTAGRGSGTYEIDVVCANGGAVQSITFNAPTASGTAPFDAKAIVVAIGTNGNVQANGSSFAESGTVQTVGGVTQSVFCPGSPSSIDTSYGCDMTSGVITIQRIPVAKTGNTPPKIDESTCMVAFGTGIAGPANVGDPNIFGSKLDHITLSGAMGGTNTNVPASNEPSCGLLSINNQEQSGPEELTFSGGFLNANFLSGLKSGNSTARGLHMPSNDGPNPPAQGPFTITQANNTTGLYTGTFTGCAANACAGWRVNITGFVTNPIDNLTNAEIVASSATTLDFSTKTVAEVHAAAGAGLLFRAIIVEGGGESNGGIRKLTDTTLAPRCSGCTNSPMLDHMVWLSGTATSLQADSVHCENDVGGDCFFVDNLASLFVTNLTGFSDTGFCMVQVSATADVVNAFVGKDGKTNASICNTGTGYTKTPTQNQGWNYSNQMAIDNLSAPSGITVGATPIIKSGAGAAAGNCTVGSVYLNTTAASASTVVYVCQPANTWTAVTVP